MSSRGRGQQVNDDKQLEPDMEDDGELQGEEEDVQEEVPDEGGYTTAGATSGDDDDDGGDYFARGLDVDHLLQVGVGAFRVHLTKWQ
jgi:hypothetical protein